MTILVTGGTGFLGSRLMSKLVREGEDRVVILDAYPNPDNVRDVAGQVEIVRGDFSVATELVPVLKKYNIGHIFHLACQMEERAEDSIRINILGTNNLFELAVQFGVQKIVYPSTGAMFPLRGPANPEPKFYREDDFVTPVNFYGLQKLAIEHIAELYYARSGLKHIGLRLQMIYGAGRALRRIYSGVLPVDKMAKEKKTATVFQDVYICILDMPARGDAYLAPRADALLSWTYVEDVADAFYLAYKAENTPHRIFNITGELRSVGEAVDFIKTLIPHAPLEIGDYVPTTMALASPDRAREELGFIPKYSMEAGLRHYYERVQAGL